MFKLTILLGVVACVTLAVAESSQAVEDKKEIFGAYPFGYRYLQPYPLIRSDIVPVAPIAPIAPIAPVAPLAPIVPVLPRVDIGYTTTGYKADLPFGSYSYGYETLPTAVRYSY